MPLSSTASPPRALGAWVAEGISGLNPGYFALVMATGIISNAFFAGGYRLLADVLFAVNLVAYPLLWLLTLARMALFPRQFWSDLVNPRVTFAFFTIVAGTGVFAVALHLRGFATSALLLWLLALAVWFALTYLGFATLIFRNTAREADIVHGGWLNAIVGTESLVILGAMVASSAGAPGAAVLVLAHMLWGVGIVLYGIFIALFANRIFFSEIATDDATPLLWVVMGAAAIATNAGSTLILTGGGMAFLQSIRPFVDGVTLVTWAWATWWIPLLLLLGIWKHGARRVPIAYTPMLWSLVFPLGMYSLATLRLSLAADFPPLRPVSFVMMWIALAAWALTGIGFLIACWRSYRRFNAASA
jgi:tellurite resistance protein TehA-like permease